MRSPVKAAITAAIASGVLTPLIARVRKRPGVVAVEILAFDGAVMNPVYVVGTGASPHSAELRETLEKIECLIAVVEPLCVARVCVSPELARRRGSEFGAHVE